VRSLNGSAISSIPLRHKYSGSIVFDVGCFCVNSRFGAFSCQGKNQRIRAKPLRACRCSFNSHIRIIHSGAYHRPFMLETGMCGHQNDSTLWNIVIKTKRAKAAYSSVV